MSDLELALKTLQAKTKTYDQLWQYYDGNQDLRYSVDRLKEVFNEQARFVQNWCGVVVDSVVERQVFKQFLVPNDDAATRRLNDWWRQSEMHLDVDDVHLCTMVTGEAYVVAWEGEAFYNDSRLVQAFYDGENPRVMRLAAKWWEDTAGGTRLKLYYPERIEDYRAAKKADAITAASAFELMAEPMANPYGVIPVFHFRRERRAVKSELDPSVLDVQDAINKLFSDMMVSGEFGAFRQRWVISNADIGVLKNAPNEIWDLPAGDGIGQATTVGEFTETQLGNFMSAMQDLASSIAKMTRTPASYFWLGARADPSGEALIAMEAPLNKKVSKYNERLSVEWERLARFMGGGDNVQAVYQDPRTVQPLTQAQTRSTNVQAGIPLKTQLRREGWTPQELDALEADKRAEADAQQTQLASALMNAQRQFDQEDGADAAGV